MNPVSEILYEESIRLAVGHGIATCSFLQRQLRIGYSDALSIIARLRMDNRIPPVQAILDLADVAINWLDKQVLTSGTCSRVPADFFAVDQGISFADADLYCALLGSKNSADLNITYSKVRAIGTQRARAAVTAVIESIGANSNTWPADGIVVKITSDARKLMGREVNQICSELRKHAKQNCITVLAVQYDELSDDLVLEVIASREIL